MSTGLPMEAVNVLQDNGLWRYAATLAAHALKRDEQSAALERWAVHLHQVAFSHSSNLATFEISGHCLVKLELLHLLTF